MPFSLPDAPFIIAVLIALTVHEYAHGLVAYWLGDPTAKYEGRLTLNPVAHLDPLGTVMFLLIRFGWGKPVPINPRYFKHYRRDTALVAIAGPISNLVLAFIAFGLFQLFAQRGSEFLTVVQSDNTLYMFGLNILLISISINLGLMAFNLLPIAPLDGSKILVAFIPLKYEDAYERFMSYGTYILLALLILERFLNVELLLWWIRWITGPVLDVMQRLAGV